MRDEPQDPESPTYLEELRRAYSWPRILVPLVLFIFAAGGVQSTISDARGNSWLGWAPFISSSITCIWWALSWFWDSRRSLVTLLMRMVTACLTVQVPLLLATAAAIVILAYLPWNAEAIRVLGGGGFHYWWDE